jgi:tetratricopeptide (TPR) repeat protein
MDGSTPKSRASQRRVLEERPAGDLDPVGVDRPAGGTADVETVSARVRSLVKDDHLWEATEALLQAVADIDPDKTLLRMLARIEYQRGRNQMALALLAEVGKLDPLDLVSVYERASVLVALGRHLEALATLESQPELTSRDRWIRVGLAKTYQAMGLPALALHAYGDPGTLRPSDRLARHRLWWRTGGPVWLVRQRMRDHDAATLRTRLAAEPSPTGDRPSDLNALLARVQELVEEDRRVDAALARADELVEEGRFAEGLAVLNQASAGHRANSRIVRKLAWVEWRQGHSRASLSHLATARELEPSDISTIQDQMRSLGAMGRFRDARTILDQLPDSVCRDPQVRVLHAELFREMRLVTLAFDAYGDPRPLSGPDKRARRRLWWRTGGPLSFVRQRIRRFETGVLRVWRTSSRRLQALDALCWPPGFDQNVIRSSIDWHLQRSALMSEWWSSVARWLGRVHVSIAAVAIWVALFQVALRAVSLPAAWAATAATVGVVIAYALYQVIFFRLVTYIRVWRGRGMALPAAAVAGMVLLAGGYAAVNVPGEVHGWSVLAGSVLLAVAGMAASYFVLVVLIFVPGVLGIRSLWRVGAREDILDELLAVLDDLSDPDLRNDLESRASWMAHLENAAYAMERNLPARLHLSDRATADWAADRARGAATALRRLKRQIAAPTGGSWDRLQTALQHEVVALATGELGRLRWAAPPSRATTRRSRWRAAVDLLRTGVVASAPFALVYATQPLLQLNPDALGWARVAGLAWFVLYLLLAMDPTLREKIETMRSITSLVSSARVEASRLQRRDALDGGSGLGAR